MNHSKQEGPPVNRLKPTVWSHLCKGKTKVNDSFRAMPGHLIRRAHQASTAIFAQEMARQGLDLTPFQFAALSAIAGEPGLDQASVSARAAVDRATIGGVIDRLVDKGLVARQVSQTDRRARVLTLTDSGADVLARVQGTIARVQDTLCAGLSEADRATLTALLQRLADNHPRAADDPAAV